uniref:hypothetical protein n=1 Tax=Vibrio cholerae TaxID=666 RepID=UPI003F58D432
MLYQSSLSARQNQASVWLPYCAKRRFIHWLTPFTNSSSKSKRVAIALCGKGNIGSSWLKLFAEQKEKLEQRHGMNFELVAVVDSQTLLV